MIQTICICRDSHLWQASARVKAHEITCDGRPNNDSLKSRITLPERTQSLVLTYVRGVVKTRWFHYQLDGSRWLVHKDCNGWRSNYEKTSDQFPCCNRRLDFVAQWFIFHGWLASRILSHVTRCLVSEWMSYLVQVRAACFLASGLVYCYLSIMNQDKNQASSTNQHYVCFVHEPSTNQPT